jgi:DNA helicase-2/ATP-dependent DNA helicase PcrA
MVDEFQDTNIAQYQIVKLLTGKSRNLCVVGDEDQGIYSWRSADIRNILNFEQDYPDLKVVVLEQNYRSTATILNVAHSVIQANKQRKNKKLWTENGAGQPVVLHQAYNEQDEALYVVREIERMQSQQGTQLSSFAVMYRTNAQSRALEDAFVRYRVPYRLIGGTRFYERREIKDVLAYLRLLQNPADGVSFQRIVNVPARAIGDKTVTELSRWANARGISLYEGAQRATVGEPLDQPPIATRSLTALRGFVELIEGMRKEMTERTVPELVESILERTNYSHHLRDGSEEGDERWQNVIELLNKAGEYGELEPVTGLATFLEDVALIQDVDEMADADGRVAESVTLITLHTAKGLEYPYVFLTGLEEGVLPHNRSMDSDDQMEEERRLLYVGVTRAKKGLYLLNAFNRTVFGQTGSNAPSRFLADIPRESLKLTQASGLGNQSRGGQQQWRPGAGSGTWNREGSGYGNSGGSTYGQQQAPRFGGVNRGPAFGGSPASSQPQRRPSLPEGDLTYKPGDKVMHPKFGLGIVISAKRDTAAEMVEVNFAGGAGLKKLDLAYAPLEKA